MNTNKNTFGETAAKVRSLCVQVTFAPADFTALLAGGHTAEELERVARDIESRGDDGSEVFKQNMQAIKTFRGNLRGN